LWLRYLGSQESILQIPKQRSCIGPDSVRSGVVDRPPPGESVWQTLIVGFCVCLDAMATGKVDFFNDTGGYGFIETDDADEDVFFHMEDVGGPDLEEGQEVEFEIEEADKGPRAKNLTRL